MDKNQTIRPFKHRSKPFGEHIACDYLHIGAPRLHAGASITIARSGRAESGKYGLSPP